MKHVITKVAYMVFMFAGGGFASADSIVGSEAVVVDTKERANEYGIVVTNDGAHGYTLVVQEELYECMRIAEYEYQVVSQSLKSVFIASRRPSKGALVEKIKFDIVDREYNVGLIIKYEAVLDESLRKVIRPPCDKRRNEKIYIPLTDSAMKIIAR